MHFDSSQQTHMVAGPLCTAPTTQSTAEQGHKRQKLEMTLHYNPVPSDVITSEILLEVHVQMETRLPPGSPPLPHNWLHYYIQQSQSDMIVPPSGALLMNLVPLFFPLKSGLVTRLSLTASLEPYIMVCFCVSYTFVYILFCLL